jgi:hypothetical protein
VEWTHHIFARPDSNPLARMSLVQNHDVSLAAIVEIWDKGLLCLVGKNAFRLQLVLLVPTAFLFVFMAVAERRLPTNN